MAINLNSKFILAILFLLGTCAYEVTSRTLPLEEASLVQRHERWMAHHARSYKDDVEKANRFKIFKQNLEFIESFNKAGNHSYKLGMNKFSDMSPEEFKATMLTDENNFVRPATKFPKGNSLGNNESTVIDPPNSVNWVERGAVTAIRDQLKCGACWAFSTVAAVEGITQIKTGRLVPLSEQQLMDCDETNNGCGGGWPTKAFQYVQEANGLMSESDYPYKGYQQATCATTGGYAAATITGFEQVEQGQVLAGKEFVGYHLG